MGLEKTTTEFETFHKASLAPGQPMLIQVQQSDVNDHTPTEEEIEAAVRQMKPRKAGSETGMKADHFKYFLVQAT